MSNTFQLTYIVQHYKPASHESYHTLCSISNASCACLQYNKDEIEWH